MDTERLAKLLLCVANWEKVSARRDAWARSGMYPQSAAALALAVLVGSNEGDGGNGVALSEARTALAPFSSRARAVRAAVPRGLQ